MQLIEKSVEKRHIYQNFIRKLIQTQVAHFYSISGVIIKFNIGGGVKGAADIFRKRLLWVNLGLETLSFGNFKS